MKPDLMKNRILSALQKANTGAGRCEFQMREISVGDERKTVKERKYRMKRKVLKQLADVDTEVQAGKRQDT